jgi:hypothetical protein
MPKPHELALIVGELERLDDPRHHPSARGER